MKTKRTWLITLVFIVCAVLCVFIGACGGKKVTKYDVTWAVDQNATVTVEGQETLPNSWEEGAELKFSVTCKQGYQLTKVSVKYVVTDNSGKEVEKSVTLREKEGVFTYKVNSKITVSVELEKTIESIKITKQPTKLTYFAGEAPDTTGMEVKAVYADKSEEVITDYTLSVNAFIGEEESFDVSYKGKTATVNLNGKVEYLVTVDPVDGTISEDVLNVWKTYNNYKAEDGKIYFSYLTIPEGFALPLVVDRDENHVFRGWTGNVNPEKKESVEITANWEALIFNVNNVKFAVEEEVPYLIINLSFRNLVDEAHLYLYEGNSKVELVADTINKDATQPNQDLKFNLTKLVEADLNGKWMDIKFRATVGEGYEIQEIHLDDHFLEGTTDVDPAFIDMNQKISAKTNDAQYNFQFHEWENTLKMSYTVYLPYYSVSFNADGSKIIINSPANEAYANYKDKFVRISWWTNNETPVDYGKINADGSWTVEIDVADIPVGTKGYAHFTLISSLSYDADGNAVEGDILLGGTDVNLPSSNVTNDNFVEFEGKGDVQKGICHIDEKTGLAVYVGAPGWDGLVVWANVEGKSVTITEISLEQADGKVYYVIKGAYEGLTAQEIRIDIEESGTDYAKDKVTVTVDEANGTYVLKADITDIQADGSKIYWPHWYLGSGNVVKKEDVKPGDGRFDGTTVTANGKVYTIHTTDGEPYWGLACLVVSAAE